MHGSLNVKFTFGIPVSIFFSDPLTTMSQQWLSALFDIFGQLGTNYNIISTHNGNETNFIKMRHGSYIYINHFP